MAVPGSQFPAEGPLRDRCRFHQPLPLTASLTPRRPPWTFPALASRMFPGTGPGWCRAVRGSRLYKALGSPTRAALPVARTFILHCPPPVCWDRSVTWALLGLTASGTTQVSHRAVWSSRAWGRAHSH